jgi:hypothetical protein
MSGFWQPPNNPFLHPLYVKLPYWRIPQQHRHYLYKFFLHNIDKFGKVTPPRFEIMNSDDSDNVSSLAVDEHDGRISFHQWFENDRNVAPAKMIKYLIMMMMGIDPMFSLDVPPFCVGKKLGLKPTLDLYKKEVRRRDPKAKVSRNIPELATVLRDELPITDPADIEFVRKN